MKIVLVNPPLGPAVRRGIGPLARALFTNSPPLGLCSLAAVLLEQGEEVVILDAALEGWSIANTAEALRRTHPDLVGLTSLSASASSTWALARRVKELLPGTPLVLGGPHLTANAEEFEFHPEADYVVLGEGETTLAELVAALSTGLDLEQVEGLLFRRGERVIRTSPRALLEDLDALPLPARHLLLMERYLPQPNDQYRLPKLSLITSRGCPYGCIFCDKAVFGRRYRAQSPARVLRELEHLVTHYGARDIAFLDSTFTVDRTRVLALCEALSARGWDLSWTCTARANALDEELLSRMKAAGCWRVRIGIESGDDRILRRIDKGTTTAQVRRAVNLADKMGLRPKGFFMLGHVGETYASLAKSIAFALELPLSDVTVQLNTPLKGTPQYPLALRSGTLVTDSERPPTFFNATYAPEGMTLRDLDLALRLFYVLFYARPKVWHRQFATLRSWMDLVKAARGLSILRFFSTSWLRPNS